MDSPQFIPKKDPEFVQIARQALQSQAGQQRKTRNIEESKVLINVTHEDAWLNINKKIKHIQEEETKVEDDMPAAEFKIKIEEQQPNDTLSNNDQEEELD